MVTIDLAPDKLGAYRIRGKLGEGGMATVYVGVGPDGSLRALKVIKTEYAQNKEFCTMFLDEGRIASKLSHENIVRIWSLGSDKNRLFMVMDLLRGHSLHALWWAAKDRGIKISPEIGAYIGAGIAAALHHAHEATDDQGNPLQIIHRDVNPSNVLISYDGDVKMIDFGLAKAVNRSSKTAAGVVKGKIGYLSPEQVSGKPLDRRADVFSLGITLYEISLGRRLFKAETKLESVHLIHRAEVPDATTIDPDYPPLLWNVVRRCLERDRDNRFPTAGDVRRALLEYLHIARPGVDMKAELAALMTQIFAGERAAQDEWLDQASRAQMSSPLATLRPPSMSGGAFESMPPMPLSSRPSAPPRAGTTSSPPSSSGAGSPSTRPSARPFSSSVALPLVHPAPKKPSNRGAWIVVFLALILASVAAATALVLQWMRG